MANNISTFASAKSKISEAIELDKVATKKAYEWICEMVKCSCNALSHCVKNKPLASILIAMAAGGLAARWCYKSKKPLFKKAQNTIC